MDQGSDWFEVYSTGKDEINLVFHRPDVPEGKLWLSMHPAHALRLGEALVKTYTTQKQAYEVRNPIQSQESSVTEPEVNPYSDLPPNTPPTRFTAVKCGNGNVLIKLVSGESTLMTFDLNRFQANALLHELEQCTESSISSCVDFCRNLEPYFVRDHIAVPVTEAEGQEIVGTLLVGRS